MYATSTGKFNEPVPGNPRHGRAFLYVENVHYIDDDIDAVDGVDDDARIPRRGVGMWFFEDIQPMTPEEIKQHPL